jgi:pullulanase/glycogen debranching enzyme
MLQSTSPPAIDHLHSLGVTAVELMPVHQSVSSRGLEERGLRDYWGYNSIGFLLPTCATRQAACSPQVEFSFPAAWQRGAGCSAGPASPSQWRPEG